jgi:DNA-binding beta-propeller fold protein YncE
VIVALGDVRYSVEPGWGRLPNSGRMAGVSMVAVDSQDQVYVFQRSNPPVLVFDSRGSYVRGFGSETIHDAHGIFIGADDIVWLVDRDGHQVVASDAHGRIKRRLGDPEHPQFQRPFNHPADAALDTAGNLYVADGYANSRIHCFAPSGELLHAWGAPGDGPGEFTTPHAIWIDRRSRVLVADRENDRVQLFDMDGTYVNEWRDLYHPMDIYEDSDGNIYVTDQIPRLSKYTSDGRLVGRCKPVPVGAHGIWGDSRGNLYLAEAAPWDRITKLTRLTD